MSCYKTVSRFSPVLGVLAILLVGLPALAASYLVNPGDLLQIDVWNEEGLSQEVLVRPDGYISFPMAGEIDTTNSTPSQVAEKILPP